MKSTSSVKFDLLENARDSLDYAVGHLIAKRANKPGDLKRAILDVAHVVELLLKERLQRTLSTAAGYAKRWAAQE